MQESKEYIREVDPEALLQGHIVIGVGGRSRVGGCQEPLATPGVCNNPSFGHWIENRAPRPGKIPGMPLGRSMERQVAVIHRCPKRNISPRCNCSMCQIVVFLTRITSTMIARGTKLGKLGARNVRAIATSSPADSMSALGRKFCDAVAMAAFPSKADIRGVAHVRGAQSPSIQIILLGVVSSAFAPGFHGRLCRLTTCAGSMGATLDTGQSLLVI